MGGRADGDVRQGVAVSFHQNGCSLRETTTILTGLGVERAHETVWNWFIGWLTATTTYQQRSRQASLLTKPLSKLTVSGLGCMPQ